MVSLSGLLSTLMVWLFCVPIEHREEWQYACNPADNGRSLTDTEPTSSTPIVALYSSAKGSPLQR
jgi:hypothetical protein